MTTKLSDYVMHFLVTKGVKHVFMLPGGGAMHLNDSLGRCEGLDYTCFFHEQAISIAAEAWGQFTNTPGVGMVTSGPGGTNAVTGVAAAWIDSTPCVILSGQAKRPDLKGDSGVRQMGSQEVDIVSIVAPITKYAVTVLDPSQIRVHLEKAWHLATHGRMGPVWLDIPLDVQAAQVEVDHLPGFLPPEDEITPQAPLQAAVAEVIKLLNAAERPVILGGNGVKLADAEALLRHLAEINQLPILLTWKMIDFLGHDHPLNFGSPGIMGCRAANFIVQNCDLLLVLGSRLEPSVTAFNAAGFGKNARKVMVDIDEAELRKVPGIDLPVLADAHSFLSALKECQAEIKERDRSGWLTYCRDLKARYPVVLEEYLAQDDGINLYVFTDMLFQQLTAEDIITPESSGASGEVTYQAMRVKQGQKIKNAAGLGAMGFGLPYAVGACLASEGKRTILVNGDGAFQLNIQELQTVVRLNLPIKLFILDNDGYGSIMATQRTHFEGRFVASGPDSGLSMPDISAIAHAYGIRSETVATHQDLPGAIARTLAGPDPALCRILVTRSHVTAPKVQAMKTADGGMISKPLEDMWPYLPQDELELNMIGAPSHGKGRP